MAVQTQQEWMAQLLPALPGVPVGTTVGGALEEMGRELAPVPLVDEPLRASNNINWWASYPWPCGKLTKGFGPIPLQDASDDVGRNNIATAYKKFLSAGANGPDWDRIANELEAD